MSSSPNWVNLNRALKLYKEISQYKTSAGLRDQGLLESALNRPIDQHYYGGTTDIAELAAAYAYGIAKNHPFSDGNKRTAFMVCDTFLKSNGIRLTADEDAKITAIVSLAEGSWTEAEFAEWIRANSTGL